MGIGHIFEYLLGRAIYISVHRTKSAIQSVMTIYGMGHISDNAGKIFL
jgi:hypothetical protein